MQKCDLSGVVEDVWYHCHDSRALLWCWNIHPGPIPSVLQHHGAMVRLTQPSISCTTPLTMGPGYVKNLIYLEWFKVSGAIAMAQGQCNVLEYPSEAYTKSVATPVSNVWAHMTLNIMHLPLTMSHGYAKM